MGNFAENLNLGNRFRPPPPTIAIPYDQYYANYLESDYEHQKLIRSIKHFFHTM